MEELVMQAEAPAELDMDEVEQALRAADARGRLMLIQLGEAKQSVAQAHSTLGVLVSVIVAHTEPHARHGMASLLRLFADMPEIASERTGAPLELIDPNLLQAFAGALSAPEPEYDGVNTSASVH